MAAPLQGSAAAPLHGAAPGAGGERPPRAAPEGLDRVGYVWGCIARPTGSSWDCKICLYIGTEP